MKLMFLGATDTVTGSKYLLTNDQQRILIDCGLFQGYKDLRLRNWSKLPIDPKSIHAVVITHAHIDHTGYLPLLVKNGFNGPIYATQGTYDLCSILLPDSGYLHEEDARRANKYRYSKHHPALPLYTQADAKLSLKQFKVVTFNKPYPIPSNGTITWHHAGHILGASFIEFNINGTKILFTGDMGRFHDAVMKAPEFIRSTDYLIIESTYGNRLHDKTDPLIKIENVIKETIKRGGTILIPAFAVGRAQSMMYYLYQLKNTHRIPNIPIYLDSPMAINASEILSQHIDELRLDLETCAKICDIAIYTRTREESEALDARHMPKIIISASGMMEGGRILHHLKVYAPDYRNSILLTGYQAGGTRGARLLMGEKELKIHGQMIPVKATVESISNLSSHADYEEILTWLKHFEKPPLKVFITHGEPEASAALKQHIESKFGWNCYLPKYLHQENL